MSVRMSSVQLIQSYIKNKLLFSVYYLYKDVFGKIYLSLYSQISIVLGKILLWETNFKIFKKLKLKNYKSKGRLMHN